MATRTANTGTNNWNTNAAWVGSVQPTAADDVIIPSGATVVIQIATNVYARSVTVQAGGTVTQNLASATLNIGDGTAGAGNVALSVSASATWNISGANGTIVFVSTSATQQTINTGGKTMTNMRFDGAGSSYILGGAVTSSGTITINAGTFNSDNYSITAGGINVGIATARTITLGSSTITCTNSSSNFIFFGLTNLTFTANTAVVNCTGAIVSFNNVIVINSFNWNGLSFVISGGGQATFNIAGATVRSIRINGTASKTNIYRFTGNFTCTEDFEVNSASLVNTVMLQSSIDGATRTITAANAIVGNQVDLMDIEGAGAATWTVAGTGATYLGDCGGNSGITFTTPVAQTITSGNWDNAANWTSRIPLPQDNVTVSGSGSVSQNMIRIGADIDYSGFTGTLTLPSTVYMFCFGSVTLGAGMSYGSNPNTLNFTLAGRGSHTITSNGVEFMPAGSNQVISVITPNGTYTLTDDFLQRNTTAAFSFNPLAGTFDSGNFDLYVGRFLSTGTVTRTINLGTSEIFLRSASAASILTFSGTPTLSAIGATFTIVSASANARTVELGGQWIGTFNYTIAGSTGQLNVTQAGIISELNFSDASNARTLQITQGISLTCLNFNVTGTAGKLMTVKSSTTTLAYLSSPLQLYNSSQDYIAYEYLGVNQPQSLWLNTHSTASNSKGIYATEPTYKHVQSTSSTATGTSLSVNYIIPTVAGNLLVAYFTSSNAQGTFTPPSGWTQAVTNSNGAFVYIFYKVADGSETTVSFTQTVSRTLNLVIAQYQGFTGTPTLDVTDTNVSSGSVTSLATTAGSPPTNTDQPALAFAAIVNPSALAATTGVTDDFVEDRTNTALSTVFKGAVKELTTLAPVETTISWTTSRANTAAVLAVFKDVAVIPTNTGNFFAFF